MDPSRCERSFPQEIGLQIGTIVPMLNPYEERESQLRQLDKRSSELLLRGDFEIGEQVANEYLSVAKDASDEWHSLARVRLGLILENAGRREEAERHARIAQSNVPIDSTVWKMAAGLLGNIYKDQGDYDAAKEQYLLELESKPDSSFALCGLSSIEFGLDNFDKARQYALRALKAACSTDDREHMSVAHNLLGDAELDLGNPDVAEKHFLSALAICEDLSRRRGMSVACDRLSQIESDRKHYGLALEYGQRVVQAEMEMGRMKEVTEASFRIAYRLDKADCPKAILSGITLCETAFRAAAEPIDKAWALRQQSLFQRKLKQYDQAEASLKQAMKHIEADDVELAITHGMLGTVQKKRKNFVAARKSFTRSLELAEEHQHANIQRHGHVSLAYCAIDTGNVPLARDHWQRALAIAELQEDQKAINDIQFSLEYYQPSLISRIRRIRFWLLGRWRS